jgi:hypothetical protein
MTDKRRFDMNNPEDFNLVRDALATYQEQLRSCRPPVLVSKVVKKDPNDPIADATYGAMVYFAWDAEGDQVSDSDPVRRQCGDFAAFLYEHGFDDLCLAEARPPCPPVECTRRRGHPGEHLSANADLEIVQRWS